MAKPKKVNPWLEQKLKEKKLVESSNPERFRLIVECRPGTREAVKARLKEIADLSIVDQAFDYIRVYAPVEAITSIEAIPDVVTISYDVPVKVLTYNPLSDPLIGSIKPSPIEFQGAAPDLLLPMSPIRLLTFPLRNYKYIPTSETRKIILDVPTELDGSGVKVAVLDTGIDLLHPQIRFKAKARSVCTIEPLPVDGCGHGSWCTTCIGGERVSAPYGLVEGVASKSDLIAIKVLSTIGSGTTMDVMKGMEIAWQEGAKIVSLSLGSDECQGGENNCPLCKIVKKLTVEENMIFVIAAGNSGSDAWTIGCPGCSPSAITVGSYSITDEDVAYFSSRGPQNPSNKDLRITDTTMKPDVTAPGGGRKAEELKPDEIIYSGVFGYLDGLYSGIKHLFEGLHGTSMATPHVSGLVALLVQGGVINSADDFKRVMSKKGTRKNSDGGWGLTKLSYFI